MDLNINFYNLLIGFGMLQGFVFGLTLCVKNKLKSAQFYLGLTVLFLSFYLLWVLKYDFGFQKLYPKLQFLPVLFIWGIGPAFYTYLRILFKKPLSSNSIKLLFLPLLIEQFYFNSCTVLIWLNNWEIASLNSFQKEWVLNVFSIEHIVGLIIIAFCLYKCFELLKRSKALYAANKIRTILICFTLLWIIWVPYTIIDIAYYSFGFPPSGFYVFYVLFALLTYCIGFYGFRINNQTLEKVTFTSKEQDETSQSKDVTKEMLKLSEKIKNVMKTEKSYLDSDLSLVIFSKKVDMHPNKVSALINTVIGCSFRDFVNAYRIDEFKSKSKSYDFKSKTILSLAYESGFNSKASFNRAFKKFNKISPAEFLDKKARK